MLLSLCDFFRCNLFSHVSLFRFCFDNESTTVAHRGKTQLNFCSETQQSFEEHNNLFENTTIFSEHNNIFENTTIDSGSQQSFPEHKEIS